MRKLFTPQHIRLLTLASIAVLQLALYFFIRMLAYTPQSILYQGF